MNPQPLLICEETFLKKIAELNRDTTIDSVALLEPVEKVQNERKLMPEVNPSTSQEMDSVDNDTLKGEKI